MWSDTVTSTFVRRHLVLLASIVAAVVVASAVALLMTAKEAEATFSGYNGKLAFDSYDGNDNEIFTINSDGTELTQLTNASLDAINQYELLWSPDGTKIAYGSYGGGDYYIRVLNVTAGTGNNLYQWTGGEAPDFAWSPDSTKIVKSVSVLGDPRTLVTTNPDGTGGTRVTEVHYDNNGGFSYPVYDRHPDWQPLADPPADTTAPTIDIASPAEGATYALNQQVQAEYSCEDTGGSSLSSCEGTVPSGSAINTGLPGSHTFTVTATDGAGNTTSVTHSYAVSESECTVTGTPANDVLEGTPGDDLICGLGGNDVMKGLGGDDVIKGGAGYDAASFVDSAQGVKASLSSGVAAGEGNDVLGGVERLIGSPFADAFVGSGGRNALTGKGGNDTLSGQGGADELSGWGGDDTLHGGPGNDNYIRGGMGSDTLFGADGDDALNSQDGVSGNDSVDGGTGTNTCTTDASVANCQ